MLLCRRHASACNDGSESLGWKMSAVAGFSDARHPAENDHARDWHGSMAGVYFPQTLHA